MSIIVPTSTDRQGAETGATVLRLPLTCREFLGLQWGHCPSRVEGYINDRGFCEHHLRERMEYMRPGGAA